MASDRYAYRNGDLLWETDFGPDRAHEWSYDIGDGALSGLVGWGNNELEYYTEDAVRFDEESGLTITATRQSDSQLSCFYGPCQWTSGKIHTAKKIGFKYGSVEVRAQMANGVGTWPALWLLGENLLEGTLWPACGEIDLMEGLGFKPHSVQGALHGPGYSGGEAYFVVHDAGVDLSKDFHDYAMAWTPDLIHWYFDGELYMSKSRMEIEAAGMGWPFDQNFYLILNLAIGGTLGGEVDEKLTQSQLHVQYARYRTFEGHGSVTNN